MEKLNILAVGATKEHEGKVLLGMTGDDMPPDCIVVFMDKESYEILKEEMAK